MKQIHIRHHWLGRLIAADPGRKRLQQAGKATISLLSSVITMVILLRLAQNPLITPAVVAGMVGMIGIMAVMDDTKKKQQGTTLLLGVSAAGGITAGSMLAGNAYYLGTLLVLVVFSAFYFSRFGSRYFSLGMIAFMTVYMAAFLGLSAYQFPWFYLAILIGVMFAFIYNFIVFKNATHMLRSSMRSYHIQANLTLNMLVSLIQEQNPNLNSRVKLNKNVQKLRLYASNVASDLNEQDVETIWPGLTVPQLRLYIFDSAMLVETLTDSMEQLKRTDALDKDEVRRIIVWVVKSLRNAEVLAPSYQQQHLKDAEQAVQGLRLLVKDLVGTGIQSEGWLYLIRRIESIANHVVEGAVIIQQALQAGIKERKSSEERVDKEDSSGADIKQTGLKPSTKKAYQALIAGTLAIIIGYIISPIQPYWVILTTFFVLLGTESIGRTYLKGFQRSVGTIFGAIIGFGLAKLVSGYTEVEVVLIFIVVFLAFYFFTVSYTLMSLFITMLIAFMYDLLLGGVSYVLLGARVLDTVVGAAIALGVSAVVFPKKTRDKVSDYLVEYLTELQPFVTNYVSRFRKDVDVKQLSNQAFELDKKLQLVRDAAQSLLQRSTAASHVDISRWITTFTAINYYAKQLVASSYKKKFDYPSELEVDFEQLEEKLDHNIDVLTKLIKGEEQTGNIYSLMEHRERIEQLAPNWTDSQRDLIHHLYYVWKINQSLVLLATEMGAEEIERNGAI